MPTNNPQRKAPSGKSIRHSFRQRHPKVSLARALSKLGYSSRTQAQALIKVGRVRVNGTWQKDEGTWVELGRDRIEVDRQLVTSKTKIYLMLNKPRGMVTTRSDEEGRATVYDCLKKAGLPWLSPVGRLDKASEGLLLFTNDTRWAAGILSPATHLDKVYHLQVDRLVDKELLLQMVEGIKTEGGELLRAKHVTLLRQGSRNSWLEVVLDEGRNRNIRRLLSSLGVNVLRLIRVAIGSLKLGNLGKGAFRHLTEEEKDSLTKALTTSKK
jgi:23S rRNA pseudouridine2605 synthase